VVPLIVIYVKYYGARATVYIVAIFYSAMVLAGIVVDVLFSAFGLVPSGARPPSVLEHAQIVWNYTSWLDLIAIVVFAASFLIHLRKPTSHAHCH
jgi:hypothetical protein